MFKLDESPTYWYPVVVEMTAQEGGRKQKFTFEAEFNRITQDELNEIFRVRGEDDAPLKDSEVLDRVFVGWRDIQDASGHPLQVNASNREQLLNRFPVPGCIVKAFLKSIGIEGKAKN